MTLASRDRQWRRETALTWTRYDDSPEWVVHNHRSADIHLVSESVHRLWESAGAGERTADELATAFAADAGRPADEEVLKATSDALAFMDRAGLLLLVSS